MHIIGILTAIAMLIFWISRAARASGDIVDTAQGLANLPRKYRHMKKQGRSGLDLISDSREAATVLMVATARLSGDGRVSEGEDTQIQNLLTTHMAFDVQSVEDFVLNIRWLTRDLKQPISTLRPMVKLLQGAVSRDEGIELADMLTEIALTGGPATDQQTDFIHRYRETMGLNA